MKTSYKNIAVILLLFLVGKIGFSNGTPIHTIFSGTLETSGETVSSPLQHSLGYFVEAEAVNLVLDAPEDASSNFIDTNFPNAKHQSGFTFQPVKQYKANSSARLIVFRFTREILFPFHSFW